MRNSYVGGGGGIWGGATKGRLFRLEFPSAKFWVKIFFLSGWVSHPKEPPPFINKPCLGDTRVRLPEFSCCCFTYGQLKLKLKF